MKSLKEFLVKIVKEDGLKFVASREVCNLNTHEAGRASLASEILSKYLTDSKFCQCEMRKRQHKLIQEA